MELDPLACTKRSICGERETYNKSAMAPLISSSCRIVLPWLGSSHLVVLERGGARPEERSTGFVRPLVGPDRLKTAYGKPQNRPGQECQSPPLISSSPRILHPWLGFSRLVVLERGRVCPEQQSTVFMRPLVGPDQLKTAYGKPQNRQGV